MKQESRKPHETRPILWPDSAASARIAEQPGPLTGLDPALLALLLKPQLARLFAIRIGVRGLASGEALAGDMPLLSIGTVALPDGGTLGIALDRRGASLLMERLFGAAVTGAEFIEQLPPGSASWMALARHMADAVMGALQEADLPLGNGALTLANRPAMTPLALKPLSVTLEVDGEAATLVLNHVPAISVGDQAPHPPGPEWRGRARSQALDIELPVGFRLFETRLPLAHIASLRPGDILPLPQPRTLALLVGGRAVSRFPAASLLPPADGHSLDPFKTEVPQ